MAFRQLASSLRRLGGNQRQLQEELDTHKLFLLTSFQKLRSAAKGGEAVQRLGIEIEARASSLSFKQQRQEVQKNVHQQVSGMLRTLHEIVTGSMSSAPEGGGGNSPEIRTDTSGSDLLSSTRDSTDDGNVRLVTPEMVSGRSALHGSTVGQAAAGDLALTWADVSSRFGERLGFTLHMGPSSVPHPDAGNGVFIKGKASPGQVIAIYPGTVFPPSRYRFIPGYPKIDATNSFLIARFDGTVIDGREWTTGVDARCYWGNPPAAEEPETDGRISNSESESESEISTSAVGRYQAWLQNMWESFGDTRMGPKAEDVWARTGALIEFRNPLAMAHYANHPGNMQSPNVMVSAYDFPSSLLGELRAYIPNVMVGGEDLSNVDGQAEGMVWPSGSSESKGEGEGKGGSVVQTLVLVATRCLEDEEVLLNYRLSPHVKRPEWYTPVDDDEDKRRWG